MSEKIKVTLEVEPGKTYTIKPLGEKLAEKSVALEGDAAASVTGTVTGSGSSVDVDGDIDF
jgi:hypothetical protein